MKVYISISTLFALIRQLCFPNPFEAINPGLTVMLNETPTLLTPAVLNVLAEFPLWAITFGVAGLYYRDRTRPINGSILYMVFFIVHSALIELILKVYPQYWLMGLIVVGYIVMHVGLKLLMNKLDSIYIP